MVSAVECGFPLTQGTMSYLILMFYFFTARLVTTATKWFINSESIQIKCGSTLNFDKIRQMEPHDYKLKYERLFVQIVSRILLFFVSIPLIVQFDLFDGLQLDCFGIILIENLCIALTLLLIFDFAYAIPNAFLTAHHFVIIICCMCLWSHVII